MSLEYLGLDETATEADVITRYKELAKTAHPDLGGDVDQFQRLQAAKEQALIEAQHGQTLAKSRMQLNALREAARGTVCPRCDGTGYSMRRQVGFREWRTVCRLCRGRGKL